MMTRLAPARRWASVFSLVRKIPVDSITTSTPTSPQADAAGILHRGRADGPSVDHQEAILDRQLVPEPAVNRVVLQQIGQVRKLEEIVHRHDLARRRAPSPRGTPPGRCARIR